MMVHYPIQLDEIDQWLTDNFDIIPGACSSTENLRYNTAKMVAEALLKRDQVEGPSRDQVDKLKKAAKENAKAINTPWIRKICIENFISGANWQKEQLRDLCYQCEKNYDNVFYRGEQHAMKMMKEEAAEGMVDKLTVFGIDDRCELTVVMPEAMLNRLGMIGYGYGLYLIKSGKNR